MKGRKIRDNLLDLQRLKKTVVDQFDHEVPGIKIRTCKSAVGIEFSNLVF